MRSTLTKPPWLGAAVLLALVVILVGCGKKDALKPAWYSGGQAPPDKVRDLVAEIRAGQVWLTWSEPTENTDHTMPPRIDVYMVYYDALPINAKFCFDCDLDLPNKLEVDPDNPKKAVFVDGRVSVPIMDFDPGVKYVFSVWCLDSDENSAGDSNIAVANWPGRAGS